jgi:hypothetical protein
LGSAVVVIDNPGLKLTEYVLDTGWGELAESTTETVMLAGPDTVAVPEITPVPAAIVRPAGKPVADHV